METKYDYASQVTRLRLALRSAMSAQQDLFDAWRYEQQNARGDLDETYQELGGDMQELIGRIESQIAAVQVLADAQQ